MIKVENLRIENTSPDKILFLSVFKGSGTAEYNTIYALQEYKMIQYSHDTNIILKKVNKTDPWY